MMGYRDEINQYEETINLIYRIDKKIDLMIERIRTLERKVQALQKVE